ncbi:MAG: heme ABC exporter ATP-binding protein CcmA [Balneolaceae bacterium]
MVTLSAEELSKSFGNHRVLSEFTFTLASGITGIAGPNGSGKSTLLRCLSGLSRPTSGKIEWKLNGKTVPGSDLTTHLGYVAPYVQLYEELTARENLKFIRDLRAGQTTIKEPDLLKEFELSGFIDTLFGELSSGQQQRVKLAAAAIHQPAILCLDEPGTNLDEAGHTLVKKISEKCIDQKGLVLLASNQSRELDLCDRIINVE